jgi:hypothetical protein
MCMRMWGGTYNVGAVARMDTQIHDRGRGSWDIDSRVYWIEVEGVEEWSILDRGGGSGGVGCRGLSGRGVHIQM